MAWRSRYAGCMGETGLTREGRLQREKLRLQAAEWFEEGVPQAEIARRLGASRQAVHVWHEKWKNGGREAMRSSGPSGKRPLVSDAEFARVATVLQQGPIARGFTGQVWTLARISRVIHEVTGALYTSPSGVWRLLKRHGWSRQVPTRRAHERNEQAVMTWRSEMWPQVKPGPSDAEP